MINDVAKIIGLVILVMMVILGITAAMVASERFSRHECYKVHKERPLGEILILCGGSGR